MRFPNVLKYKQAYKCSCEYCREQIFVYRNCYGEIVKEERALVCYGVKGTQLCEYEGNKHKCRIR